MTREKRKVGENCPNWKPFIAPGKEMFVCANTTEPLSDIGSSLCLATQRMLLRESERERGSEKERERKGGGRESESETLLQSRQSH